MMTPDQMWRDLAAVKAKADTDELREIVARYEYILTEWMPKPDEYDEISGAVSRIDRLRRLLGNWRRLRDLQKRAAANAAD